MNHSNPFQYGMPVSGPDFFGRRELVMHLQELIWRRQPCSLVGERRMGKTSILRHLEESLRSEQGPNVSSVVPLMIDCERFGGSDVDALPREIVTQACKALDLRQLGHTERPKDQAWQVAEVCQQKGCLLLLLLDEIEFLATEERTQSDTLSWLRGLLQSSLPVACVTASDRNLARLDNRPNPVSSPFYNIFRTILIGEFSTTEAEDLLIDRFVGPDIQFDAEDRRILLKEAGLHPFFLQMGAYHLFEAMRDRDRTGSKLHKSFLDKFDLESAKTFEHYWIKSSEDERRVLARYAVDRGESIHPAPKSIVNRLRERALLVTTEQDELRLFSRSFARWIQQSTESESSATRSNAPPAFYAEPCYIGSHQFVGRARELEDLSDWARPADPTNLLLYEAIGGNGKSMLTWEWTTNHATQVRDAPETAWAGRFWYSFYERGAIMADFCQRALAYMTGQPLKELRKKKTAELREPLLAQLHARPWLLILDGLERVLVAYHRIDAAEMPDEDANNPTDKIVHRNPCDAIRDEDNDLLRALAAAAPSKILVSSRLTPRVLLNPSGQPITGVKRITLPGLRPSDAEQLLRSCGIEGDSAAIQSYLATNCDNHPLVIGILGGLINNYLPARGDFDVWATDPDGGAKLDLASLDLIQRRNHILRAALDALPAASRQLLSTLALLSESVNYETLSAFNPHEPPDANKLAEIITNLEQRGLLQYDGRMRRYDLHPVVRGVAAGGMKSEDKELYGQRVVDYFSSLPHNPYVQAETLEDLRPGLNVVRTLLKLGQFERAAHAYQGEFAEALEYNIEAYEEMLSLLRPCFAAGWNELPRELVVSDATYLANDAANAFRKSGELNEALAAYGSALSSNLERKIWAKANVQLYNISANFSAQNLIAGAFRVDSLALDLATERGNQAYIFLSRLALFSGESRIGQWADAEATWQLLDPMGREWSRAAYLPGEAESVRAHSQYWKGTLQEEHLSGAEQLAAAGKNRGTIRDLHGLRGAWRLEHGEWTLAATSFAEAVRMARESGIPDAESETGLALAKHHLGQLAEPQREAERLSGLRNPAHRLLARLWLALGDDEQAKHHALAAYRWAWADGEPYVHRYELTKTTELLQQMNVPIPNLPPYNPAKDEPFPWEADVHAAIESLRAETESQERD